MSTMEIQFLRKKMNEPDRIKVIKIQIPTYKEKLLTECPLSHNGY